MLAERIRSHLDAKVAMFGLLAVGIVVPYFSLQRWHFFPPRAPFVTPLDAWIPFAPEWAPAYLSVCLLVPLFPLLATRSEDVWRYLRGIAALCLPCFACFLFFPMPGPRPEFAPPGGAYEWLVGVDATWNAFPSLHAGLVLLSFLYGWRAIARDLGPRGRALFALGSVLWGTAILYGTLATKQHWVTDLPLAFVLAWVAHWWSWREAGGAACALTTGSR
jgi:PAP2 superfamily